MSSPRIDKVAVMGAGAVGCYFGAMLARAGIAVRLIGRPALVDAVSRDGLQFNGVEFTGRISMSATADPAGVAGAELVLFCVKSADTEAAARAMAPHLLPGAVILDLQNGVDNVERIRTHVKNVVVPAVVYVSAEIAAPGVLRHNGRGDLVIGEAGAHQAGRALIADLADWLSAARVPTRVSDNVEGELWWKLTVNCAYNAISALGRSRYGSMMAMPAVRQVMSDAVREILALAQAKGVRIAMPDPIEAVLRFADAMPQAMSSTAQDVERGRPTEIEYLNGYVVRECEARGVEAPVNRTLYALVKLLEQQQAPQPSLGHTGPSQSRARDAGAALPDGDAISSIRRGTLHGRQRR
ncbi:MAG: ketopantoate reductase family protein [Bradyrhizobiaceae bacterium]|nr:ketopantoate reductase family protein [Bradyrhizobiaceae bacterium]